MTNKWQVKKLNDLCDVRDGTHESPKFVHDGYPLITSKNLIESDLDFNNVNYISENDYRAINRRSAVDDGDILFGMIGTIGNPVIVNKYREFAIKNVALIKFNSSTINNRYLLYLLKSNLIEDQFKKVTSGSTQKFISLGTIRNLDILLPDISKQLKIGDILSSIDEAIQKTDQIIQKTEELKRGIMQDLLSFGSKENVRQLALGEIGKVSMCKRVFKNETSDNGEIPFYKIGTFGKKPDSFISQELYDSYRKKYPYPKPGDVLLSASGTIGRKVKYDGKPAYFQDSNIVWLEHDESKILNDFLFYTYDVITWQTEGSTIKRLYNDILLKKVIPVPSIKKQRQIILVLLSVDEKISKEKKFKNKLSILKAGLMHDIFNQKVQIN